ncbi:MAG TPA: hypothetical protein VII66_07295, partial [Gemmatimonadaceae bacterium]
MHPRLYPHFGPAYFTATHTTDHICMRHTSWLVRTWIVSCLGVALPAANLAAQAQFIIPKLPVERYIMPNGLTVILSPDHSAHVTAVDVWYHVGSKNELPGRTGFAHLF